MKLLKGLVIISYHLQMLLFTSEYKSSEPSDQDGSLILETFDIWCIYSMPTDKTILEDISDYHWIEKWKAASLVEINVMSK